MKIDIALSAARSEFTEALIRVGFVVQSPQRFVGEVSWKASSTSGTTSVEVILSDSFPFGPPYVHALNFESESSWHLDADGGMCLWDRSLSSSDLPWADVDRLVARIAGWLAAAADGWPNDPPDLDLERYLVPERGMFVYDEDVLNDCIDREIKIASRFISPDA